MIAIVLVIGAVAAIVALSSGKKEDLDVPATNYRSSNEPVHSSEPEVKRPPAYPPLPEELRAKAREIADKARELKKQGEEVYQAAMTARREGDQDLWQEKLVEAADYFEEIKELWNELIGEMPSNNDYDEEEVANHYLGREADIVTQATRRLADIKKQRRL